MSPINANGVLSKEGHVTSVVYPVSESDTSGFHTSSGILDPHNSATGLDGPMQCVGAFIFSVVISDQSGVSSEYVEETWWGTDEYQDGLVSVRERRRRCF